jgi:hypothetical protein
MANVPNWLWQELVADAIWTGIAFGAAWTLKNRREILTKLRSTTSSPRQGQYVDLSGVSTGRSSATGVLTISKDLDLRWNVEAPTPSLARRLEELASWYLHVS